MKNIKRIRPNYFIREEGVVDYLKNASNNLKNSLTVNANVTPNKNYTLQMNPGQDPNGILANLTRLGFKLRGYTEIPSKQPSEPKRGFLSDLNRVLHGEHPIGNLPKPQPVEEPKKLTADDFKSGLSKFGNFMGKAIDKTTKEYDDSVKAGYSKFSTDKRSLMDRYLSPKFNNVTDSIINSAKTEIIDPLKHNVVDKFKTYTASNPDKLEALKQALKNTENAFAKPEDTRRLYYK